MENIEFYNYLNIASSVANEGEECSEFRFDFHLFENQAK